MIRLIWSAQSVQDVEAIRAYIAADSPIYADLMVHRIVAAVERLQAFPDSGRAVPERQSAGIREVIVGSFRIVYRRADDAVEIATVFRGSRQVPELDA